MCGFSAATDGTSLSSGRFAHKLRKQNSHSLRSRLSLNTLPARNARLLYDFGTTVNLLTVLKLARTRREERQFAELCANKRPRRAVHGEAQPPITDTRCTALPRKRDPLSLSLSLSLARSFALASPTFDRISARRKTRI